jgi:hypothetical protein
VCQHAVLLENLFLIRIGSKDPEPHILAKQCLVGTGGEPFPSADFALWWQGCGEPAISHDSYDVSLVQWTTCLLPATRDTGSNPPGGLM